MTDPVAADVHVSTEIGNGRRRKWPLFKPSVPTITKAGEWRTPFAVKKSDPVKRQIFGWASVVTKAGAPVVDFQDDMISPATMESAAYDFVLNSRQQGHMHEQVGVGKLIESMVFTLEKQRVLGIDLGQEGWWTGFYVESDDVWKSIKAGQLPEFSIGGKAIRTLVGD